MIRMKKSRLDGSLGLSLVLGVVGCGAVSKPPADDQTTVTIQKPAAGSPSATNPAVDAGK
ncbi:MAG: hypothetical protein ABTD50_07275 [Polyangiaceae bacterium]|jgi:hypothetical protein